MSATPDSTLADRNRLSPICNGSLSERRPSATRRWLGRPRPPRCLQVINSSPGDLAPVFEAMLERAMLLCRAAFGEFSLLKASSFGLLRSGVHRMNLPSAGANPRPAQSQAASLYASLAGEHVIHIADVKDDDLYRRGDPHRPGASRSWWSTHVAFCALRKDEVLLGTINIYRQEVRPFSDKQIALLQNFAAQAVIAMENARLMTETREALEQQTATAEVLQVINSSPGDLAPVFDAMLEKAMRLCEAAFGSFVSSTRASVFRAVAVSRRTELRWRSLLRQPIDPVPGSTA